MVSSQATQRTIAGVAVLLALAACGSSDDGPAPGPTPTGVPEPTPAVTPQVAAMVLASRGRATSVSPREWITVELGGFESERAVVLPPDAGPAAGPLPVPGCALGAPPEGCAVPGSILTVGESDWSAGDEIVDLPSFPVPFPAAFGPAGEVEQLTRCCGSNFIVREVVPAPGARFLGVSDLGSEVIDANRGILWRSPGPVFEMLPAGDFGFGPLPRDADEAFTIVGEGLAPTLPVAWLPAGDAYDLVTLPLASEDVGGGAVSIDDGRIAGWSDSASSSHALVWQRAGDAFAATVLPALADAPSCAAVAISGARVVGSCHGPGREVAVVWASGAGDPPWTVAALLSPAPGDVSATVSGLSGTLAVGWSTRPDDTARPVAWRLP